MPRKITPEQIQQIRDAHAAIQYQGTEELGYTDSGLWLYLDNVFTKDSHDKKDPVKKLPVKDKVYLQIIFLCFLCCEVLALPKSRQIMVSWCLSAYAVWVAMGGKFRDVLYQTKKEEDAFAMVTDGRKNPAAGRMDFIIQHMPTWLRDPHIIEGTGNRVGELVFAPDPVDKNGVPIPWNGSKITAMPAGAHQVRGKTPLLCLNDESAFQDDFAKVVIAVMAAIKGGGQFIAASSVDSGSDFNSWVLDVPGGGEPVHRVHPIVQKALDILGIEWPRGMKMWETTSGVWVLETHYTADPAKDPDRDRFEWYAEAVKGYQGGADSTGWKTEMEIDYGAGGGDPVFQFLKQPLSQVFIPHIPINTVIDTMRLGAGYDYGAANPSAFIVWGINAKGQPHAVWELYEPCLNIAEHSQKIRACPYWNHLESVVSDPSVMSKTQQTASGLQSLAEQFADHGIDFMPGRKGCDVPMAVRMLSEYWSDPDHPDAFVTDDCPNLKKELRGLKWEKRSPHMAEKLNNPEKIRDKHNHACDASWYYLDTRPSVWAAPGRKANARSYDEVIKRALEKQNPARKEYGIHVV